MLRRKIHHRADAHACLDAAAVGGLTRAAWAHANGVDARSLQAWRLALERREAPREPLRLVELVVAEPAPAPLASYVVRCGSMAVDAPDAASRVPRAARLGMFRRIDDQLDEAKRRPATVCKVQAPGDQGPGVHVVGVRPGDPAAACAFGGVQGRLCFLSALNLSSHQHR